MNDHLFNHIRIFLVVVGVYMILYNTLFSCLVGTESGFQTIIGIVLTAIIMTVFELGFIWINYYVSFNNSGKEMVDKEIDTNAELIKKKFPSNYKEIGSGMGVFAKAMAGQSVVDNNKVDIINTFANTAALLLIFILILFFLLAKAKGATKGFHIEPRTYMAAVATAVCIAIFFGFFFFSTTGVYKMMPNDMDILSSVKDNLETGEVPETRLEFDVFPVEVVQSIVGIGLGIIIIYTLGQMKIGNRNSFFGWFQSLCK